MIPGVNLPVLPLTHRGVSRAVARAQRQELAILYEAKAEAEHRESTRAWELRQEREAERFEAEMRRQDEIRRRERDEARTTDRRRIAQHDRQAKALAALADAKNRNARVVGILVALVAGIVWGREPIADVLAQLGMGRASQALRGGTAGPTPEAVDALRSAITEIMDGDDVATAAIAVNGQAADLHDVIAGAEEDALDAYARMLATRPEKTT
jgi:hypothetical protein